MGSVKNKAQRPKWCWVLADPLVEEGRSRPLLGRALCGEEERLRREVLCGEGEFSATGLRSTKN
jgi:hypothetical protein